MLPANDPTLRSWVETPPGSDFPIQNLPFGIFSTPGNPSPRAGSIIGDFVIDLSVLEYLSFFDELDLPAGIFHKPFLNDFIALGKEKTLAVRNRLSELLREGNTEAREAAWHFLHPADKVELRMPIQIGDYTDFYSSLEHASNLGSMFRDPSNPLLPNWRHLPVGYHGRASSIVLSGTPIRRPVGQTEPGPDQVQPPFGPSRLLDFELEMAFVVGKENPLGQAIPVAQAEDHIFGLLLFNDWSARDIQRWEYQPLGPFLSKNFASSVSPWIVVLEALEAFRIPGAPQEPPVLPYLQTTGNRHLEINLEIGLQPAGGTETIISRTNTRHLYWSMSQQLAHHTVGGCNMRVGDLCASGTISGTEPGTFGSMIELTWRGTKPLSLPDRSERKFLLDGDTVTMRAFAEKDGLRIGFGGVTGTILPAQS